MPQDTADQIYKANYWDAGHFGDIDDQNTANHLFDMYVNTPKGATYSAQHALIDNGYAINPDNVWGPATRGLINQAITDGLTREFNLSVIDNAVQYYQNLVNQQPGQQPFLQGWLNRANGWHTIFNEAEDAENPFLDDAERESINNLLGTPLPEFPPNTNDGDVPPASPIDAIHEMENDLLQDSGRESTSLDNYQEGTDFSGPDPWRFTLDPGPTPPAPLDPGTAFSQNDLMTGNVAFNIPSLTPYSPDDGDDPLQQDALQIGNPDAADGLQEQEAPQIENPEASPSIADTDAEELNNELSGQTSVQDDSLQINSSPSNQPINQDVTLYQPANALKNFLTPDSVEEDDPPSADPANSGSSFLAAWHPTNVEAEQNKEGSDEPLDLGLPRASTPAGTVADLGAAATPVVSNIGEEADMAGEAQSSGSPM
jgi:hypothetical protein